MGNRTISHHGIMLLEAREGIELTVYLDTKRIPTVGVGHVVLPEDNLKVGDKITHEQCDAFFENDLQPCENVINSLVKVPLTQNQFDALVSFIFNVGVKGFRTSAVLRDLNAGKYDAAAADFMHWITPPQITGRRRGEMKQFLTPDPVVPGPQPIPVVDPGAPPDPVQPPTPDKPDKPPPDPQVIVKEKASVWSKVWTGVCAAFSALWTSITGWYASDFVRPIIDHARDSAVNGFSVSMVPGILAAMGILLVIGAVALGFLWAGAWIWNHEKNRVALANSQKAEIASDPKKATVEFTADLSKATANIQAGETNATT